jgi:hypothetical protein
MYLTDNLGRCVVELFDLGLDSAGTEGVSCEHAMIPLSMIKNTAFLDKMSDYQRAKNKLPLCI